MIPLIVVLILVLLILAIAQNQGKLDIFNFLITVLAVILGILLVRYIP